MDERVRFLEHKGQQILLCDFSHCPTDKLPAVIEEIRTQVSRQAPNSVLTLADFTGAEIDKAVATRMKEALAMDRPYVKRSAWVVTESLPKVFYDNFKHFSRREFPTFATREEAMEWLVSS